MVLLNPGLRVSDRVRSRLGLEHGIGIGWIPRQRGLQAGRGGVARGPEDARPQEQSNRRGLRFDCQR
jgi:hypothetical protein